MGSRFQCSECSAVRCGTVQGLFLTKGPRQITENCIVCNIPNLLKCLKMCGSRSQEGLVHVDRPGGEGGEELTGFYFYIPPCSL